MYGYGYPWGYQPAPARQQVVDPNKIQGVRWASSFSEVSGIVLPPGEAALFMFTDENAFAIKRVSPDGTAIIKEFEFTEKPPRVPEGFVRKEELDDLRKELEDVKRALSATENKPESDRVDECS